MERVGLTDLKILPLHSSAQAELCAQMMASSEPWLTLGRSFADSLKSFTDAAKEVYLAILNDAMVGFVILTLQGAFVGYIQSLYVVPEHQGRKIGEQLLGFAEQRIWRDSPNVFICVSSFNPKAQRFYARLGYETIGELRDYIIAGHSEILLRKTIAPLTDFIDAI